MTRIPFFNRRKSTHENHNAVENFFGIFEKWVKHPLKFTTKRSFEAIVFLIVFFAFFGGLAYKMTLPKMLNTFMQTSYHLLLETVFYIMAICVLMGAISKMLTEFGVVRLLENLLRPLMKPLYNLPGVAALGAVMTFLSDNPAIITLAHDKNFNRYFKKYQLVSLTNFGTAFGMGLVVIAFMTGLGFGKGALIGLAGAIIGSIVSTRLMQRFTLKAYPELDEPISEVTGNEQLLFVKIVGHRIGAGAARVNSDTDSHVVSPFLLLVGYMYLLICWYGENSPKEPTPPLCIFAMYYNTKNHNCNQMLNNSGF